MFLQYSGWSWSQIMFTSSSKGFCRTVVMQWGWMRQRQADKHMLKSTFFLSNIHWISLPMFNSFSISFNSESYHAKKDGQGIQIQLRKNSCCSVYKRKYMLKHLYRHRHAHCNKYCKLYIKYIENSSIYVVWKQIKSTKSNKKTLLFGT